MRRGAPFWGVAHKEVSKHPLFGGGRPQLKGFFLKKDPFLLEAQLRVCTLMWKRAVWRRRRNVPPEPNLKFKKPELPPQTQGNPKISVCLPNVL